MGAGGADVVVAVFRVFYEVRLAMVQRPRFEALAEFFDARAFCGREGAVVGVGGDALARVEGTPGFTVGRGRGRARVGG